MASPVTLHEKVERLCAALRKDGHTAECIDIPTEWSCKITIDGVSVRIEDAHGSWVRIRAGHLPFSVNATKRNPDISEALKCVDEARRMRERELAHARAEEEAERIEDEYADLDVVVSPSADSVKIELLKRLAPAQARRVLDAVRAALKEE